MCRAPACRVALLIVVAALAACERRPADTSIGARYDPQTGRLRLLTYDSNGSGQIDTWTFMDGPRVIRVEIDTNEDGVIDRWEYYDERQQLEKVGFSRTGDSVPDAWAFQGPDGDVARIEISLGRDGIVNRWEYYEAGALVRAEEDLTLDGAPNKWEVYDGDRLASVAFDETGDGQPDRRLTYGEGGVLLAIETEPDGQGRFTSRIEVGQP